MTANEVFLRRGCVKVSQEEGAFFGKKRERVNRGAAGV